MNVPQKEDQASRHIPYPFRIPADFSSSPNSVRRRVSSSPRHHRFNRARPRIKQLAWNPGCLERNIRCGLPADLAEPLSNIHCLGIQSAYRLSAIMVQRRWRVGQHEAEREAE